MKVFLTGAGGYIGLHILRALLDAGNEVSVLVRSRLKLGPFLHHRRLTVFEGDIEQQAGNASLLFGHQVCIHAALIWGDDPGSELEVRDVAVAARLFDSCARAGVTRCIYISSVAVHRPFHGVMCEDSSLGAADLYGATKAACELFLRATCAGYSMTGIVVRPGIVVGSPAFEGAAFRSDQRIREMVIAARENLPVVVPDEHGRQFTDVSLLTRAVRQLVTHAAPCPAYLCVDREVVPWEWIAQQAIVTLRSSSEMYVTSSNDRGEAPRFLTERIERLLGGQLVANAALSAHISHLARSV